MTIKMKNKKDGLHNEETRVQSFVKQMLVSRMFVACYVGRFYVEQLKTYRDVLCIHTEEKDVIKDMLGVKNRILNFYKGAVWPAFTGPNVNEIPTGHCIWVRLNKNLPLGEARWFMIEDAAIGEEGELIIKIKDVRNVNSEFENSSVPEFGSLDTNRIKQILLDFLQEKITWGNMKEIVRFVFILIMAIVTVLLTSLQYLGDLSLQFFREFNNFIRVSTPIFLAIIDLIKKAVGGFYILLAMIWGGNNRAPPPQQLLRLQERPYQIQRRQKY